jgi:hypothetical protein
MRKRIFTLFLVLFLFSNVLCFAQVSSLDEITTNLEKAETDNVESNDLTTENVTKDVPKSETVTTIVTETVNTKDVVKEEVVDEIWSLVHRHYKNSLLDIEFLNAQIIQLQRSIEFRNLNLYYDHKTRKELEDLEDAAIRLQSVSITDLNDGWFELSMYSGLENLISYKLKGVCELGY